MTAQEVAPGIRRISSHDLVNWYLVEEDGRVAAVDAGLPPDWDTLEATLRETGRTLDHLEAVVLTHAHVDHTGFAERARQEAGATVHVHEDESELMRHQLRAAKSERNPLLYARHAATRTLMLQIVKSGAWHSRPVRGFTTFRSGDELADVPGRPRVVATPGHTYGHCAFHFADRDALVTRDPYTGRTGPRLVARAATADVARSLASLDAIAATGARTILPGHGAPWTAGAGEAARLARDAGSA